jgi:hypothetical protein
VDFGEKDLEDKQYWEAVDKGISVLCVVDSGC